MTDPGLDSAYVAAATALRVAPRVFVCAHVDPDGDAIGSMLGLVLALRQIGIDAVPVAADAGGVPPMYRFLPGANTVVAVADLPPEVLAAPGCVVALDTPTLERLGDARALAQAADTLIDIDHHPDNRCFGTVTVHDSSAAAAGSLVWRLLRHLDAHADAEIATCLYTALVTDTGRFQYSNTDSDTLREAAAMLDAGAHSRDVFTRVYEDHSAGLLNLVGRTLSRLTLANHGSVAWSWIEDADLEETGVPIGATENLIDVVRQLGGVDVVFLVKVRGDECRVSLRSKGSSDVGAVARAFGGGGHAPAAGFTFGGTLEELINQLLPALPDGAGETT